MAKKRKKRIKYDPYEETMEDALRDEGKSMRIDLTAYHRRVKENDELINELTTKHHIEHVEEHRELIRELDHIKIQPSLVSLEPDDWQIPKDAPDWTKTRAQLTDLAINLDKCVAALDTLMENPTFQGALNRVDPERKFGPSSRGLSELHELMMLAASIQGEKGNRPNPDWMQDFAKACRDFWREHMTSAAYPKFKDDRKETPSNPFTKWAWDVMQKVGDFTLQQCGTELDRLRSKGGQKDPN